LKNAQIGYIPYILAFFIFKKKIAIYISPSYRRSLQPSKENIRHFKKCR
jgi:hypothetical protein